MIVWDSADDKTTLGPLGSHLSTTRAKNLGNSEGQSKDIV